MKTLYLVDISSIFFRAFYALPPMTNTKGIPTNAIYGFLAMTTKLLREVKPDHVVFCFDSKEPSFRSDIFPEYKANREEMPEDLAKQMPFLYQLTELLGVPSLKQPGFEADDIIGTLAVWGRKHALDVVIVSSDKDFAQLVKPHVRMYDSVKDSFIDESGVKEKWGVRPDQFRDYLALRGDTSDNIPGIKGVGEKTAQKLLSEYESLDGVFANAGSIKGAIGEKIRNGKASAYLSQKLVTIVTDMKLDPHPDELKLKPIDREKLGACLDDLEIKSLKRKLLDSGGESSEKSQKSTETAVQVERENIKVSGDVVDWGASEFEKNLKAYTELEVFDSERGLYFLIDKKVVRYAGPPEALGKILGAKMVHWKGYDLKRTWRTLKVSNPLPSWDYMLAAYVIRSHEIDSLAQVCKEILNEDFPELPSPQNIFNIFRNIENQQLSLLKQQNVEKVYRDIELPSVVVLYDMETRGIILDSGELRQQSVDLAREISVVEKEIFALAGETFNVASPKQLGRVLFDKLKLPAERKTKTGFSTDSDVLEKLSKQHEICQKVIDYREYAKLKSTYVDALPELVDKNTGRIHTTFNQALTNTGRLSSQNPNLQNIPIRTERGKLIRKAFKAEGDHLLLSADYSQIELRVLAHLTEDKGLVRAFADDIDVHAVTASEVFGVNVKDVDADQRRKAKAVNFGIAYGQGPFGLAESLGISRGEASEIIKKYFQKFPGVREFMESTIRQAREQGYVESYFGRRRYLPELKSPKVQIQKFGERAAINAPVQSTASDLMKMAMVKIHADLPVPLLLQVHDELLFESPKADIEENAQSAKSLMENIVKFNVPMKVNVSWGPNWYEAH